jgi:hypothetical protein
MMIYGWMVDLFCTRNEGLDSFVYFRTDVVAYEVDPPKRKKWFFNTSFYSASIRGIFPHWQGVRRMEFRRQRQPSKACSLEGGGGGGGTMHTVSAEAVGTLAVYFHARSTRWQKSNESIPTKNRSQGC